MKNMVIDMTPVGGIFIAKNAKYNRHGMPILISAPEMYFDTDFLKIAERKEFLAREEAHAMRNPNRMMFELGGFKDSIFW